MSTTDNTTTDAKEMIEGLAFSLSFAAIHGVKSSPSLIHQPDEVAHAEHVMQLCDLVAKKKEDPEQSPAITDDQWREQQMEEAWVAHQHLQEEKEEMGDPYLENMSAIIGESGDKGDGELPELEFLSEEAAKGLVKCLEVSAPDNKSVLIESTPGIYSGIRWGKQVAEDGEILF